MAAVYEYLAASLTTGLVRDAIPLDGVKYGQDLNRKGSLEARLPRARARALAGVVVPGDTLIYVLRDGQPVWAGWLHTVQADQGGLRLAAEGLLGYFDHQVLRETRTYTGVDQATIAADLIAYTTGTANPAYGSTAGPGGGLPVAVSAPATGITRDRTYAGTDRPEIGRLIQQLSEVQGGPDVGVVTTLTQAGDGTRQFTHTFTVWPVRGSATTHALIYGANVDRYAVAYDAARRATRVEVMNDADSVDRLIAWADTGNPVTFEQIVTRPKVTDLGTLQSWADQHLATYRDVLVLPAVSLDNPPDLYPGVIGEGDTARLIINDGWVQVDGTFRVIGWSVTVGGGGSETLDLAFAEPTVTGGTPT